MVESSVSDIGQNRAPPVARTPIAVKAGLEARVIEIAFGDKVETIVDIVARDRGCRAEELVVFRDGVEEALDITIVVDEHYPHRHRHHVHHKTPVDVIVHYNGATQQRSFPRQATIDKVLTFAIGAFTIDPTMATEFELARAGTVEELPGGEHIGHLASHHRLELNLVRGTIANG